MIALRLPFAVTFGALLSLGLFFVLWGFVSRPLALPPMVKGRVVEFSRLIVEKPAETKRQDKPHYTPPDLAPELPAVGHGPSGEPTVVNLPKSPVPVLEGGRGSGLQLSADAIPLVRVSPDYPPAALARSLEGWVQVQFSVGATGLVQDAKVVNADPPGVFDQAALRAVARWRYNPMIEDGKAVVRVGLQTVIRFELAK
jgi:periplasmic protein TonB